MSENLILFETPKVHVFSLPPSDFLKSDNWEGKHIWSGSLKLVREGNFFAVRLFEPENNNELFGECPIRESNENSNNSESVQPATDSTRAFVLRVEEGQQFSYVGLLFDDRTVAYNFNSALIHRRKGLGPAPTLPVQDHTLEKGEAISIDLFGKVKVAANKNVSSGTSASSDSATSTSAKANKSSATGTMQHADGEIPRVSLFSLHPSTGGKSRRVQVSAETIAAAAAAASNNNQNNAQSNSTTSSTKKEESNHIDSIFGSPASGNTASSSSGNASSFKAATTTTIDDVFGGGGSNSSGSNKPKAVASPTLKSDVLDSIFG